MARMNAPLLALNRGEVSKMALARIDVEKMRLAAETQVNWLPFVMGPAMLRPGLQYIGEVKDDRQVWLIDFVFAPDDCALLELTGRTMRVWIDDVLLTRAAVGTTISDPNFAGGGTWSAADTTAGCSTTISGGALTLAAVARGGLARASQTIAIASADRGAEHGLRVVVDNGPVTIRIGSAAGLSDYLDTTVIDSGTHSLAFTPAAANAYLQIESRDARQKQLSEVTIEAAGIVEIPTPWFSANLPNLRWTQSGDIVYVASYGQQQYKIERRGARPGARGWSVVKYRSDTGPFFAAPTTTANITPTAMEGNGSLTSDAPVFTTGHVGALFRLFTTGQTNQAVLGGEGAYTEAIRVAGVGNDRVFGWGITGTWTGTLTLQRSVVSADTGFVDVSFITINDLVTQNDSGTYPNVVVWYRVGFKPGDYGSGSATVFFGQIIPTDPGAQVGPTDIGDGSVLADDTWTDALEVPASTAGANITIAGSWVGTLTLQSSTTSALTGFTDLSQFDVAEGYSLQVGLPSQTTWYRIGFKQADYTSGTATLTLSRPGTGGTGGSSTYGAAALAGGRFGICRVTGYTSPTSVDAEILAPFSSLEPTSDWQQSMWSDAQSWPSATTIQEGRLWFFGQGIWGSQSSNYVGFAEVDENGDALGDAGAIIENFGEGPTDHINWALPLTRILCGRERSIASIRSSSFDEPLTPANFSVKDCSQEGAARLPPIKVGKRGIYVQGRRIYELAFNPSLMDYDARDMTRLNLDIGAPGFVDTSFAVQPDKMAFLPRSEGQCACLLYDPDDEVEALWRIMTLGLIERVRVLPSVAGVDDQVYFIVKRVVNGVTKRFIEKLASRDDCVGGAINKMLDCFVSYSGTPVSSITAAHLPNTELAVWADGAFIGSGTTDFNGVLSPLPDNQAHGNIVAGVAGQTVTYSGAAATQMAVPANLNTLPCEVFADQQPSGDMTYVGTLVAANGTITLPLGRSATSIVAFFGYQAPFMSAKLAYAAQMGTAATIKKKVDHVGLMLFDAGPLSLKIGQRFDALDSLPQYEDDAQVPANIVWSEYDEPGISVPGEWNTDARLCVLGQAPYPVKIGGVVVTVTTNG